MTSTSKSYQDTLLTHAGRNPSRYAGYVNPPIFRGSTILAESLEAWEAAKHDGNPYGNYGRFGSPTINAFEDAIAELEGGHRTQVFPSGLSACTHTLLALLEQGDHVLITDNVYGPTRSFADEILPRAYGYPMKIRVPTKLGFKNPKYVISMEVTNDYKGGYWEDQGYNSFSGS